MITHLSPRTNMLSVPKKKKLLLSSRTKRDAAIARRNDEQAAIWGEHAYALAKDLANGSKTTTLANDAYPLALSFFHLGHLDRASFVLKHYTDISSACCTLYVKIKYTQSNYDAIEYYTSEPYIARLKNQIDPIPYLPGECNRISILYKFRGASYLQELKSQAAKNCFLKALEVDPQCLDAFRALSEYRLLSIIEIEQLMNQIDFINLVKDTNSYATDASLSQSTMVDSNRTTSDDKELANVHRHIYLMQSYTAAPSLILPLNATLSGSESASTSDISPLEISIGQLQDAGLSEMPILHLANALVGYAFGDHNKARKGFRYIFKQLDQFNPQAFVAYFDYLHACSQVTTDVNLVNEIHEMVADLLLKMPSLQPLMDAYTISPDIVLPNPHTQNDPTSLFDLKQIPSPLTSVIPGITAALPQVLISYAIACYLSARAYTDSKDRPNTRPAFLALLSILNLDTLFVPGMLLLANVINHHVNPMSIVMTDLDQSFTSLRKDEIAQVYQKLLPMPQVVIHAPEPVLALARVARSANEINMAIVQFREALIILDNFGAGAYSELAQAKGELGALYVKTDRLNEGTVLLHEALETEGYELSNEIKAPILLALAHATMMVSHYQKSRNVIMEALQYVNEAFLYITPSLRLPVYLLRGEIFHRLKRYREAINDYQAAHVLAPGDIGIAQTLHKVMAENAELITRNYEAGTGYDLSIATTEATKRAIIEDRENQDIARVQSLASDRDLLMPLVAPPTLPGFVSSSTIVGSPLDHSSADESTSPIPRSRRITRSITRSSRRGRR